MKNIITAALLLISLNSFGADFEEFLGEYTKTSGECPDSISVETFGYGRYLNVVNLKRPNRMRPYMRFEGVNEGADFVYSGDNSSKLCYKSEMGGGEIVYLESDWVSLFMPCSFASYEVVNKLELTNEGLLVKKGRAVCEYKI